MSFSSVSFLVSRGLCFAPLHQSPFRWPVYSAGEDARSTVSGADESMIVRLVVSFGGMLVVVRALGYEPALQQIRVPLRDTIP